jgi:hypothetical protein
MRLIWRTPFRGVTCRVDCRSIPPRSSLRQPPGFFLKLLRMQSLRRRQQTRVEKSEAHTQAEFAPMDAVAAIATMTDHPVLIHVPVGTGAAGREPLRRLYREVVIP